MHVHYSTGSSVVLEFEGQCLSVLVGHLMVAISSVAHVHSALCFPVILELGEQSLYAHIERLILASALVHHAVGFPEVIALGEQSFPVYLQRLVAGRVGVAVDSQRLCTAVSLMIAVGFLSTTLT